MAEVPNEVPIGGQSAPAPAAPAEPAPSSLDPVTTSADASSVDAGTSTTEQVENDGFVSGQPVTTAPMTVDGSAADQPSLGVPIAATAPTDPATSAHLLSTTAASAQPIESTEVKISEPVAPAHGDAPAEAPADAPAVPAPSADPAAVAPPLEEHLAPSVPEAVQRQEGEQEGRADGLPTEEPAAANKADAPSGAAAPELGGASEDAKTESAPVAQPESAVPPTGLKDAGAAPAATPQDTHADTTAARADLTDESSQQELGMPHVKFAQNSLRSLKSRREAAAFLQPVDPVALKIPHYTQIIKEPMDLGTIDQKLALTAHRLKGPQNRMSDKLKQAVDLHRINAEMDYYRRIADFEQDLFRVFDNCLRFNGPEHIFTKNADVLRGVYEKQRAGLRNAAAVANEASTPENRARRSPNALPTIRRSSSNGGRPKREIHPPPPRDLPWTEDALHPASKRAIAARSGKSADALTPREQAYWSKVINDELKFCYRLIDDLLRPGHRDLAWVFYDVPAKDFDWAPAYYATIKKPIALLPIQRKLKNGAYADLAAFDADMQLMFNNCFTFNPPDSDVYVMGARFKDVYESKLAKKPVPAPLEDEDDADDDDDDDDEEEFEDDSGNAVLVDQLQRQIAELQGTLETLEHSKTKNPVLITSTRVALNSVQAALDGALSISSPGRKKGKKRSASALEKKKAKGRAANSKSPSAGAKRARSANGSARKGKRDAGSDEEDIRTVTFDQKEELATKITELSDERLDGAIRIINEDKPAGGQGGDEEIELDIDELSPQTLYKLYKYVVRPKKRGTGAETGADGKAAVTPAPIDGRKRGTGGLKKKNLDESEEAERIARLQQQLQQFNDPSAATKATPTDAAADPAASSMHDDLVQSDSSSGDDDDESDSESDMD